MPELVELGSGWPPELPRSSVEYASMDAIVLGVFGMSSIVVRGLAESVKARLAAQAKQHGRSMEAEVREILTQAATRPNIGLALLEAAQSVGGVDDLPIPERADIARAVDFS